ncbi:MAG: prepilin-type N-terminal cleavage/methylation domain-containing protein [Gammaproteobacteria bacterium]|nr:prepilin-type N-terminal cleavage/methylation domain-containing protein [Gammaproteobacteria bacterium]MDH5735991.1 prepilin-type N-terminal cleavage/methylation domain-containing protein [Gammaproteobacteria bacterium]
MSIINKKINAGFTLIEIAIVLVIIGALISAAIMPLSAQRDTNNIKKARAELKTIEEAIYGFAIANGRIPCPAQPASAGSESPAGGTCNNNSIGFVPAATLGVSGNVNCNNLLVDPWGNPYRYSVTSNDSGGIAGPDFTTPTDINTLGVAALNPDIRICTNSGCGTRLTDQAVAVVFSMGKNWSNVVTADEIANAGEATIASGCTAAYDVAADNDYVSHLPVEIAGLEFDDIVIWISPNILYAKLLAAGQL